MTAASAFEIARVLGLRRSGAQYIGSCPACAYKGAFTVSEIKGRTLVHCHSCQDQDAVMDALRLQGLWGRRDFQASGRRAAKVANAANANSSFGGGADRRSAWAARLWEQSLPAAGTTVETYLALRGITGPIPLTLRFQRSLEHRPTGTQHPAMIAAVKRWPRREVIALHRTYLHPDGDGKAAIEPNKMTLGPVAGGAVRLAPAGETLAISEGIETGLSVLVATGTPTWAALSAGGIKRLDLPPLPIAAEIVIAADPDPTGLAAAYDAAERWHSEGRRVRIAKPPPGQDFNELLMEEGQ